MSSNDAMFGIGIRRLVRHWSIAIAVLAVAAMWPALAWSAETVVEMSGPQLKVKPHMVNFGNVNFAKRSSKTKFLRVYNRGNTALHVQFGDVTAPFKIACSCSNDTIPPHGEVRAVMAFQPTSDGTFSERFQISSDAGRGPANIVLTLRGKAKGTPPSSSMAVSGTVTENQTAVADATVNLYAAADDQDAGGSGLIFSTSSDPQGKFSFASVHCPDPGAQVYVTAEGGTPNGCSLPNKAVAFMAALGSCGDLQGKPAAVVNEDSTAAAASALAPYISSDDPTQVGSSSTRRNELANAFAYAENLTGSTIGSSLSNALATCAQCGGAANASCQQVLACSAPNSAATSSGCTGGSVAIEDTLAAALSLSGNPPQGDSSTADDGAD